MLIHHLIVHAGRPLDPTIPENLKAVEDLATLISNRLAENDFIVKKQLPLVLNPNINIRFTLQLTNGNSVEFFASPLTAALCSGNLATVSALLERPDIDPNHRDEYNGEPPLSTFISHYKDVSKATRSNCLALLLNHQKTDLCLKDSKGFTPRAIALETNNSDIAKKIIAKINKRRAAGQTVNVWEVFVGGLHGLIESAANQERSSLHEHTAFIGTYHNPLFIGNTSTHTQNHTNEGSINISDQTESLPESPGSSFYQPSPLTSRSGTPIPEDEDEKEEWYDLEPSSPGGLDGLEAQFSTTEEITQENIMNHPDYV